MFSHATPGRPHNSHLDCLRVENLPTKPSQTPSWLSLVHLASPKTVNTPFNKKELMIWGGTLMMQFNTAQMGLGENLFQFLCAEEPDVWSVGCFGAQTREDPSPLFRGGMAFIGNLVPAMDWTHLNSISSWCHSVLSGLQQCITVEWGGIELWVRGWVGTWWGSFLPHFFSGECGGILTGEGGHWGTFHESFPTSVLWVGNLHQKKNMVSYLWDGLDFQVGQAWGLH